MQSAVSHEPATTQTVDLHDQAESDASARAAAHVPPSTPPPGGDRLAARLRRSERWHQLGRQLWVLLHAQELLDVSDTHPYQR